MARRRNIMQAISSRSIPCHRPGALALAGLFVVVGLAIPGYTQTVTSKKSSTEKPATTEWDPIRIARAWTVLMKRLGYTRFVAQFGEPPPSGLSAEESGAWDQLDVLPELLPVEVFNANDVHSMSNIDCAFQTKEVR